MEEEYGLSLKIENKEIIAENWNRLRIEVENSGDGIIRQIVLRIPERKGVDVKGLGDINQLNPKEKKIIDSIIIRPVMMTKLPLEFIVWFIDSKDKFRQIKREILMVVKREISMVVKPPQRLCGLLRVCPQPDVDETEEYFEAHAFTKQQMDDLRDAIEEVFESEELKEFHNLKPYHPEKVIGSRKFLLCKICEKIRSTRFGFYEISDQNPNVMLELGMAIAFGKPSLILVSKGAEIPSDLRGIDRVEYESFKDLTMKLKESISGFLKSV